MKVGKYKATAIFAAIIFFALLFATDATLARKSFGRRGSFGGRRSFYGRSFKRSVPRSSFGGRRSSRNRFSRPKSFGGSRVRRFGGFEGRPLRSSKAYTSKYGAPKRQIRRSINADGVSRPYILNSYGGYASGLMTGYVMGRTSWLWFTPFHPAFYYSRPYYVENPDGTVSVYPPTFSFSKLLMALIIFGSAIYVVYVLLKNKKRRGSSSPSSFS